MAAQHLERSRHHRQRLVRPALARAQPLHGRIIRGQAGKMKATDAFDGHAVAGFNQLPEGIAHDRPVRRDQAVGQTLETERRAAGRAGIGLGVETAVGGIVIFPLAGGAHAKGRHGGVGAIIGHPLQDGEARPAVGAVGEGIGMAPVLGISDLGKAGRTGGQIRPDAQRCHAFRPAGVDHEAAAAPDLWRVGDGDVLDHRRRRRLATQRREEITSCRRWSGELDHNAGGIVPDRTAQAMPPRQTMDEGPEADALHRAGDPDQQPLLVNGLARRHRHRHALPSERI